MNSPRILFISFEFQIPFAHSLKEKRQPLKSLKERIKNRFNVSIAEIDAQDEWQRAVIGITMLSTDRIYLERQAQLLEQFIQASTEMELSNIQQQWL